MDKNRKTWHCIKSETEYVDKDTRGITLCAKCQAQIMCKLHAGCNTRIYPVLPIFLMANKIKLKKGTKFSVCEMVFFLSLSLVACQKNGEQHTHTHTCTYHHRHRHISNEINKKNEIINQYFLCVFGKLQSGTAAPPPSPSLSSSSS